MFLLSVPVDDVVLFVNKTTTIGDQANMIDSSKLRPQPLGGTQVFELAEFEPAFVCCQSRGGHPAPELRVFQVRTLQLTSSVNVICSPTQQRHIV